MAIIIINILIQKLSTWLSTSRPIRTDSRFKVVAISDVHLGYATNKAMLEGYVDLINAERPDLVIIGGDLIDNSVVPLHHEHMEVELSRIYAPLGVYMVPGNHEYISGIEESEKFIAKNPDRAFARLRNHATQSSPIGGTGRPAQQRA